MLAKQDPWDAIRLECKRQLIPLNPNIIILVTAAEIVPVNGVNCLQLTIIKKVGNRNLQKPSIALEYLFKEFILPNRGALYPNSRFEVLKTKCPHKIAHRQARFDRPLGIEKVTQVIGKAVNHSHSDNSIHRMLHSITKSACRGCFKVRQGLGTE